MHAEETPSPDRVFVYGTLRPETGHPMAAWLALRSAHEGRATVAGRLLDLGRYPALLADPEGRVVGDLVRLESALASGALADLDRYEGVRDRPPLFRRVRERAERVGGGAVETWVYVWARCADDLPVVVSGDWLDRSSS